MITEPEQLPVAFEDPLGAPERFDRTAPVVDVGEVALADERGTTHRKALRRVAQGLLVKMEEPLGRRRLRHAVKVHGPDEASAAPHELLPGEARAPVPAIAIDELPLLVPDLLAATLHAAEPRRIIGGVGLRLRPREEPREHVSLVHRDLLPT